MQRYQTARCRTCGREVSAGAQFCPGCGANLRAQHASLSTTTVPPREAPAAPPTPSAAPQGGAPPQFQMAAIQHERVLRDLDTWIIDQLGLEHYGRMNLLPTLLCETIEEFIEPVCEVQAVSEAQLAAIIEAESTSRPDGCLGVYLPHRGMLINGWLFQHRHKLPACTDALDPERYFDAYCDVVETVAHEKWGHGFLFSCTTAGREAQTLGMDHYRYADLFRRLRVTQDKPDDVILSAKWNLVFRAQGFAQEGWARWVDHYVAAHWLKRDGRRPPSRAARAKEIERHLDQVINLNLRSFASNALEVRCCDDLQALVIQLISPHAEPADACSAMQAIETCYYQPADEPAQACRALLNNALSSLFGQPPEYVLGWLLCELIELRWGLPCVPAALVLAHNVSYNLASVSVSDLELLVSDPRMNVNQRLAQLAHMPREDARSPATPQAFARSAHDWFSMAIPTELR